MIPGAETYDIDIDIPSSEVDALLETSITSVSASERLTVAKNVFVPLTTACRYTCGYCTFFDPPGSATLQSPTDVKNTIDRGVEAGCTEVLFTFGDDPDDRYAEIHQQLDEWGFDSIHAYLRKACEIAIDRGLLPHINPGDQTQEQMIQLKDVVASMGVMLETVADVPAHGGPRAKTPGQRLHTIKTAGELNIPFTTGILVGIGETRRDRARSLIAIKELHEQYDHIQEVLVQPVSPNKRWERQAPSTETMQSTVAMARAALPETVAIQVPPNLTDIEPLIQCGVDDLGGVSPVTDDHVNPDYEWPQLESLSAVAASQDLPLYERLPVYDRYLPEEYRIEQLVEQPTDETWMSDRMSKLIEEHHRERFQ